MSGISNILIAKGKELLNNSLNEIANEAKTVVVEKTVNITEKGINRMTEKAGNFLTKKGNSLPDESANEVKSNQAIEHSLEPQLTAKDNNNSKEYTKIVKQKVVDGKISSSSSYFLKLERERLNISDELGEEIEENILTITRNTL